MTEALAALSIRRTIAVRNRIEELATLYALLETVSWEAGLSETVSRRLLLVCEELFGNIVRYGYPPDDEDMVELTVDCGPETIVLTFIDHAVAHDVSQEPAAPAEKPLDEMEPGGLGLLLVHHFATSVQNRREGRANITEVLLAREAENA